MAQAEHVTKSGLQILQNSLESKIDSIANMMKDTFEKLLERVKKVEKSCNAVVNPFKKRHEDDDNHNPHGGRRDRG